MESHPMHSSVSGSLHSVLKLIPVLHASVALFLMLLTVLHCMNRPQMSLLAFALLKVFPGSDVYVEALGSLVWEALKAYERIE